MGIWSWATGKSEPIKESKKTTSPNDDDYDDIENEIVSSVRRLQGGPMRLSEAIFDFHNLDAGTEDDDRFYINLNKAGPLDLPQERIQSAQRLSLLLYRKNPRAFAATELVKDFVIGEGIRFAAVDDKVQQLLDDHWALNQWDDKLEERIRALALFGEQLYKGFTNEGTGLVKVASISPFRIVGVLPEKENAEEPDIVVTSVNRQESIDGGEKYKIIKPNDDLVLEGDAFYFALNRVNGGMRGLPDMVPSLDWLEGLDQFIFSTMERANVLSAVVWDLLAKNLNETELRKEVRKFVRAVKSGSVYGHNDNIELKPQVTDVRAQDADGVVKILQRQVQSGMRLAGLFFGDAEDLTRASASELSVPVAKMIQGRQGFVKRMIARIFMYQIQEAQRLKVLPANINTAFKVELPKVFLRDISALTKALMELSTSLTAGVDEDWITNDQASLVYKVALEQIAELADDDTLLDPRSQDVNGDETVLDDEIPPEEPDSNGNAGTE